jgi:hypothetical protein
MKTVLDVLSVSVGLRVDWIRGRAKSLGLFSVLTVLLSTCPLRFAVQNLFVNDRETGQYVARRPTSLDALMLMAGVGRRTQVTGYN